MVDLWATQLFELDWPAWLVTLLIIPDILIRLIALGWVPYRRKPAVGLGWLLAIFFIPYVGIIAFLIFGSSKLPAKRRKDQQTINDLIKAQTGAQAILGKSEHLSEPLRTSAQLNYSLGALPMTHGNSFSLLPDNHEAIRLMAKEVEQAKKFVHVEFYIAAYDSTTAPFFDALKEAAERGVHVRVLVDHIGCVGYPGYKELVKLMDNSPIDWRRSLPVRPWRLEYQRPDLRNHRKIVVIDGEVGFTGSLNAIDKTYNKRANVKKGFEWKDLAIRCTGPVVNELDAVFATDWYSETGDIISDELQLTMDTPHEGGTMAQAVPSGPGFPLENNLRLFNHLVYNANRRVVIVTPYFVPNESLKQALTTEAHSGVDVRIYVSEQGNHAVLQYAQESFYEELMENGVKIFLYPKPTILHSKFILIDDNVTVIGSSNMDERSFAMNMEISLLIVDEGVTSSLYDLEEEAYVPVVKELNIEQWRKRSLKQKYLENVCRLTSSLL